MKISFSFIKQCIISWVILSKRRRLCQNREHFANINLSQKILLLCQNTSIYIVTLFQHVFPEKSMKFELHFICLNLSKKVRKSYQSINWKRQEAILSFRNDSYTSSLAEPRVELDTSTRVWLLQKLRFSYFE
jgi:hypothetical protein